MRNRRRRNSGLWEIIGALLLIWVIYAVAKLLVEFSGLLVAIGLTIMALVGLIGSISSEIAKKKARRAKAAQRKAEREAAKAAAQAAPAAEAEKAAKPETKEEESPYSPEVQAVIKEGRVALKEMGRLYNSIPKPEIRSRINQLMAVSDQIIRDAIDDPADVPQIRKFLDFYLPTTIRLLNAYDRMSAQEYAGENITGSMERIEEMLDTTIEAYKKQLDALFANQAANIQIDIDTMNTMLAREGLGGKGYLDIKDFMKQYGQQTAEPAAAAEPEQTEKSEQTMKGSTANG
jgi:5-bromo-4-chloroindolyl phosphate hydrolysis protein